MKTERALSIFGDVAERLSPFQLVSSAGGGELVPLHREGEYSTSSTLVKLLLENQFLVSVSEEAYLKSLTKQLGEESIIIQNWKELWGRLSELSPETEIFQLRNLLGLGQDQWDDSFYLFTVKDPEPSDEYDEDDEYWWAIGTNFVEPQLTGGYDRQFPPLGRPPAPPNWLSDLLSHQSLIEYGQETFLQGESHSSGSNPALPMGACCGLGSKEPALQDQLLRSGFLQRYFFSGFGTLRNEDELEEWGQGERDALVRLDQTIAELGNSRLYVLGHCANYNHFTTGETEDGNVVALHLTASWS